MHDLDHPLDEYALHFKETHSKHVSEYFEALVRRSGVNEQENAKTVAEFRALETEIGANSSLRNTWWLAGGAALIVAVAATAVAFSSRGPAYLLLLLTIGAVVFLLTLVRGKLSETKSRLQQLALQRDMKRDEAWAQMEPLNRLHTWNVAPTLFEAAFPAVQLDPYVSRARVSDLVSTYGLSPEFSDGRSAVFSQSGAFNDNPLVFQRSLHHWIGTRTYSGSLVIHWTERTRDSNGNYINVRRSQTLTASVIKPHPEFEERTALIYGHEAAPNLSFSRNPSKLSGLDEGWITDWRKTRKIKKIERQARRDVMTGDGHLTVMSDKGFEALFHATNRDDETAFRLLFTPLAQREMVKLLNDRSVGFGDDFALTKLGPINIVQPQHLDKTRFDGDPRRLHSMDLAEARRLFTTFHAEYFKSLYFSLAPLLTIPLYREKRTVPHAEDQTSQLETCEWEHESVANLLGEARFQHPQAVTRSLLKTTSTKIAPAVSAVNVTAHGYGGVSRIDYVPVRGGDGNVHAVPVHWTEYYAVQAWRTMLVGVVESDQSDGSDSRSTDLQQQWNEVLHHYGIDEKETVARGPIACALLSD
jgi:hypothetical protein